MEGKKKSKSSKPRLKSLIKWGVGLVLVAAVFFAGFFVIGYYLRENLSKAVLEKSDGIYEIRFAKFEMLFLEMGFRLTGFELIPNLDLYQERVREGKAKTALYQVSVPSCELRGLNFFQLLFEPGLELKELSFSKPNVRILANTDSSNSEETQEYDDVGPIVRNLMDYLIIDHVVIREGIFDLFVDKEDRIESFTASKISLDLKGFRIDNNEGFKSKKFLYSEGYEIHLQDYKLHLADRIHTIEANEIGFSSVDSSIFARGFNLSPGQRHPDSLYLLEKPYYHFFFPELMLRGADIQSAYLTDTMAIRLIHVQRPNFQIFNIRKNKIPKAKKEFTGFTQNLFPLIQGYLNEVTIDSVLIGDGTFDFYEPFEKYPENVEIEGINVSLENFRLDSSAYLTDNNLLYAREFWLDFESFRMDLRDSLHEIKADSLFISSKLQAIRAEGFAMKPKYEVHNNMNYVDISVPAVIIEGLDLIKAYHKNILGADLFDLENPVIRAHIGRKRRKKVSTDPEKPDFVALVSKYFDTISVKKIQLKNGLVDFSFLQKGRRESIYGDQINVVLTGFEIDSMAAHRRNRVFFSRHLDLEIQDYDFLLDELHEIKVKKMTLSTRRKKIDFQDITFAPKDTTNVIQKLKEIGQTTLFDFRIPRLSWEGVDIFKLLFQDALVVRKIHVTNPTYNLTIYPKPNQTKEIKPILEKDIKEVISSFVKRVQVKEFFAENALVRVRKEPHKEDQFWTKAPLDIRLIDFHLDSYKKIDESRFFFAEDLQITMKDYDLDLGQPGHSLFAKKITFSSKERKLIGEGLKIRPKIYKGGIFPFKMKFRADFPKLTATGIDLKTLLEKKKLVMRALILESPDFRYQKAKSFFSKASNNKKNSKNGFQGIQIDKILTRNGNFSVLDEKGKKFFGTHFEGPINNLKIDEYSVGPNPTRFLANHIELKFSDGFLLFGDGLHKFIWEKLSIDQRKGEIVLLDGKLEALPGQNAYKTLSRTQKFAYRSGSVKKLVVKGFDADEFVSTGNINIKDVSISDIGLIEFAFPQLRKKTRLDLQDIVVDFPKDINQIAIDRISLNNFHFLRYNVEGDSLNLVVEQGNIFGKISGVKIRNGQRWDNNRIGFADDITLLVRNFNRKIPGTLLDINAKEVGISTGRNEAFVYDFHVKPWYGKYLHSRKLGYQVDRTEIKIEKIFLREFDLLKLYHEQYLDCEKLLVEGLWVNDHRDKRVPERKDFFPPMPQEILKKMEFRFNLDSVELTNGEINYEEYVEGGKMPGTISFTDFSAVAVNVTSDPDIYRQKPYLKMYGKAELMGEGEINFNCNLNIRDPGNKFDIWGSVGAMDMRKINPMVENVAFTTIKSGYIKSLFFQADADDHFSTGTMQFKYTDFKIALINKNTGQVEGLDKGFISFLANTFVVNTKNPHLGMFREGSIFFKRLPNKSIINYWWKSLFTGIKTSIGAQNERKLHKNAEKPD